MYLLGLIIIAVLAAIVLLFVFLPVVAWSLLGFAVFVFLVLIFIPIGVDASYLQGDFSLSAKIGPAAIKLFPRKKQTPKHEKKPKEKKKEEVPADKPEESKEKKKFNLPFNFEEIMQILKKALKGLGKFGKLTVHNFMLHYVAAGKDPYSTAMSYGYVNAALSGLAPLCAKSFKVKGDVDVWTDVDFCAEKTSLDAQLTITLRLAQLLRVALVIGFGVLCVLIKNKLRRRKELKAEKNENKNAAPENNKEEKTNIKAEERTDSNG